MTKSIAREYQRSFVAYIGGAFGVLSAASMLYGNLSSLENATFSQMLLYLILPVLASLALGVMLLFRTPPLYTVIPAALGCLVFAMLEGYLTLLFTSPETFALVWSYLDVPSVVCIAGSTVCMLAGGVLYVLAAMGVLDKDALVMGVLGLGALFLLAEYLVSMLQSVSAPSPWYMIAAVLMLAAMIVSVLCFAPKDVRRAIGPAADQAAAVGDAVNITEDAAAVEPPEDLTDESDGLPDTDSEMEDTTDDTAVHPEDTGLAAQADADSVPHEDTPE